MWTIQRKLFVKDFQKDFTVLKQGKLFAVLVSSDLLYALEDGNEGWEIGLPGIGEIITFFKPKRTGPRADISPHHDRTIRENQRLKRENGRQKRELAEYRSRERDRKHRAWQERANRWSRERGISPR